ncbi:MAG: zinc-binding dehydrogenase [Acidobacteria bacterium]|nr:zinc-binding dehydrogenase [Acidobacteriota bacterium]
MKAACIHEFGAPDVLRYQDVPDPVMRANQVLVRVRACALNHLDLWVRAGIPGLKPAMPHILGADIAGEVVAVGDLCQRVRVGQRVIVAPGTSCRQCLKCFEGRDNECAKYRVLGTAIPGGNAELIAAEEYGIIPIPDDLPFEAAAASPLVFLTAWHMLFDRARLQPGEDVLVLSASSGVGMAAIQIAKLLHCRVIATAGGDEKMAKARALGADEVIDHYAQDISAEVRRMTGKRGVDVVFEHVGQATWNASMASLASTGRLITCGATTGPDCRVDLRFLFSKHQTVGGCYMGSMAELHKVLGYIFRGKMKPVVDSVFPLAEVRAAHERIEAKQQFGKVVVLP